MKPKQKSYEGILAKFTGFAENGAQMTRIYGVYEQMQPGKKRIQYFMVLEKEVTVSVKENMQAPIASVESPKI